MEHHDHWKKAIDSYSFDQPIGPELEAVVKAVIAALDSGQLRVASQEGGQWQTHQWLKKAILMSFKVYPMQVSADGMTHYYDKVPLKYADYTQAALEQEGARIVPHAMVRKGAHIGPQVVLMPSFVNIGAYIGEGSMIDTWATVGSCAQIGRHVHISGGAGIGGVLEPLQATPTIIEDHCFIGARSEIVEGVIVEHHSVIAMGVYLSQSTKIYDRTSGKISYGRIPSGSVVVPGSIPSEDGTHALNAAIIVKTVDEETLSKVSINDLLRDAS